MDMAKRPGFLSSLRKGDTNGTRPDASVLRTILTVWCMLALASALHAQDSTYVQWDPPLQISSDPYNSVAPQIVVVGDTIHLLWTTSFRPVAFYSRSTDAGSTWSLPVVLDDTTEAMSLTRPRIAAANTFAYLFWTNCVQPCNPNIYRYVVDVRRSTDAGAVWAPRVTIADDGNLTANYDAYASSRDSMVGFGNERPTNGRFGKSEDAGLHWNFYPANTDYDDRYVILAQGIYLVRRLSGIGLPVPEVGYLYSTNFGQTWSSYTFLSSSDSITSDEPDIAGDDEGHLYAAWRDGKYGSIGGFTASVLMRRSTDYGATWLGEQNLTPTPSGVFPHVSSSGPSVAVTWDDTSGNVAFRLSTDQGMSFGPIFYVGPGGDNVVTVANRHVHVAWFDRPPGGSMEIFYRRGIITTTGVATQNSLPGSFHLLQNYPNPFNPKTSIHFDLPRKTHVRLEIYDVLGREVELLVEDERGPGSYDVQYDATLQASGIYFYRMETPVYVAAKKMVLIK